MTSFANKLTSSLRATSLLVTLFAITQLPGCGSRTAPVQDAAEVKDLSLAMRGPREKFYGFYGYPLKSISSGGSHTCAIDDEGVKCWGWNGYGQTNVPAGLKNPKLVSSGGSHTCAIDDEGVKCWGSHGSGQTNVPAGLKNPKLVSSGGHHTCAIDDEGMKCWEGNGSGQTNVPAGLKNPKLVSSGSEHTCAVDYEGVKCWGGNNYGQTNVPTLLRLPPGWQPWPQILSQSLTGDKLQFFNLIQKTIFESMPSNADINSQEHQILVMLMTRYVTEFPSDFFRQTIKPVWESSLQKLSAATSIHSAKDIPQTKATLTVTVKLLNSAFVSVKPMLGSSEQKEVEAIVLAINDTLARDMTSESAKALANNIKTHKKLLDTMAASDAVHITSVVTQDALAWILGE